MNHIKELRQAYRKALREYEDALTTMAGLNVFGGPENKRYCYDDVRVIFNSCLSGEALLSALRLAEDALQDALDDAAEANSVMIHAVLREVGSDMVQIAREMQQKMAVTGEVQP